MRAYSEIALTLTVLISIFAGYIFVHAQAPVNVNANVGTMGEAIVPEGINAEPQGTALPASGDSTAPEIINIQFKELTTTRAVIEWESNELTVGEFYHGTTVEYELDAFMENSFNLKHIVVLNGLSPNTEYHFKIIAQDRDRNISKTGDKIFRTNALIDTTAPPNAINLQATSIKNTVVLRWKNPEFDFKGVVVVRSEQFYPLDIADGVELFRGNGYSFIDTRIAVGTIYYYAVFVYDGAQNYASGAYVTAQSGSSAQDTVVPSQSPAQALRGFSPKPLAPIVRQPITTRYGSVDISFNDFAFYQDTHLLPIREGTVTIESGATIHLTLDADKVPAEVQSVLVAIYEGDRANLFQLKRSVSGAVYESYFVASPQKGYYSIIISFYNPANVNIYEMNGRLRVIPAILKGGMIRWMGQAAREIVAQYLNIVYLLFLLVLLLILYLLTCRRGRQRKDVNHAGRFIRHIHPIIVDKSDRTSR